MCIYIYTCLCTYTHTFKYVYVCIYLYIYIYIFKLYDIILYYIYFQKHTYIYIHKHTHTHIYIYTYCGASSPNAPKWMISAILRSLNYDIFSQNCFRILQCLITSQLPPLHLCYQEYIDDSQNCVVNIDFYASLSIWQFPKIGVPPNYPFNRIFPYKPSIWGCPQTSI